MSNIRSQSGNVVSRSDTQQQNIVSSNEIDEPMIDYQNQLPNQGAKNMVVKRNLGFFQPNIIIEEQEINLEKDNGQHI